MTAQRQPDEPAILKFPASGQDLTASQVVAAYVSLKRAEVKADLYSAGALARVEYYLSSFLDFMGHAIAASRLVNSDMRRWILHHPEWHSSNTIRDAAGVLCACFNWAATESEIVSRAPFKRAKHLCPPPEPQRPVEPDEVSKILKTARLHDGSRGRARPSRTAFRVGLFFLWDNGIRTKELRIARIEWLNWQARILDMPASANKTGRKTGQRRIIPLGRASLLLLRLVCAGRQDGLIFRNGRKMPWTCRAFASQFRIYARMCGVPDDAKPYACRHGFTVEGLECGLNAKELGDILGHTGGRQVDRIYGKATRFRAKRLTDARDKLDRGKRLRENDPT